MFKKIIQTIYFTFISIVLISIILAGWTSYTFISQSTKSAEIANVVQDIFANQKSIVIDIIDLSKILIKNTTEPKASKNNNSNNHLEKEIQTDIEDNPQLDESLMIEDNGNNPLGIVIEQSELNQEPLVNEEKEISMFEMDMDS